MTSYLIHVSLAVRTKVLCPALQEDFIKTPLLSFQSFLSICSHKSLPGIVSTQLGLASQPHPNQA